MMEKPKIFNLEKKINNKKGYLICLEDFLFNINFKRVFWISGFKNVSELDERGNHGHLEANELIIVLKGQCNFTIKNTEGTEYNFFINNDQEALLLPKGHILKMNQFNDDTLLLVICDINFKDDKIIY